MKEECIPTKNSELSPSFTQQIDFQLNNNE